MIGVKAKLVTAFVIIKFFESLGIILIIISVKPSVQKVHTGRQLTPRVNRFMKMRDIN